MTFVLRYWKQLTLAAILAITHGCMYRAGGNSCRADMADMRADAEKALAEAAKAETKAVERARKAEQANAQAVNDAAAQYEQGKRDGESREAERVAGLQSGNLRLRREIAALHTERLSGSAAASGQLSPEAQRGAELVAAAIGVGATCDAQVSGLQAAYEALRK